MGFGAPRGRGGPPGGRGGRGGFGGGRGGGRGLFTISSIWDSKQMS